MNETDYMHMPRLRLERPNGRGSGSALQMFLVPATACEAGHIRIEIADQRGKTRFNWANALAADLGWYDCAKLLSVLMGCTEETSVLMGCTEETADDRWDKSRIRVKDGRDGTVRRVNLRHVLDPEPGYILSVTDLNPDNADVQCRVIRLTYTEGLGIEGAIRGGLHTVAFGVPVLREVR